MLGKLRNWLSDLINRYTHGQKQSPTNYEDVIDRGRKRKSNQSGVCADLKNDHFDPRKSHPNKIPESTLALLVSRRRPTVRIKWQRHSRSSDMSARGIFFFFSKSCLMHLCRIPSWSISSLPSSPARYTKINKRSGICSLDLPNVKM